MRKLVVGMAVAALALAGCGGSSSPGAHSASPTSAGSHGTAPIKIALLGFETGVYATPDRHNSLELAIKQINAAGGVDGHPLEYTAYDTGILPQTTVTAVQKAIADHPTVILGLSVSSGVQAAAAALKRSGIPVIQEGQDNSTDLSKLGVTNMFRGQPSVFEQSKAAVTYLTSLHPSSVGVFDDSDLNSAQAVKLIKDGLAANGVHNIVYREIAQNGTDATEAALAMRGTSVTTSDGFPVEEAIYVRALATNGVGVHDLMGNSGLVIAEEKLAPWSAVAGNTTYSICDPEVDSSPPAQQYVTAYKQQFPTANVALSNPVMFDAVNLVAKAVEAEHGDISSRAIVDGLGKVSYDGVCDHYQSDREHTLAHTMYIVQFGAQQGQQTLVARYENLPSS